jgi:hypothetical protein
MERYVVVVPLTLVERWFTFYFWSAIWVLGLILHVLMTCTCVNLNKKKKAPIEPHTQKLA